MGTLLLTAFGIYILFVAYHIRKAAKKSERRERAFVEIEKGIRRDRYL